MSTHYGYQGFRSQATMVPPSLPIGETTESRDCKFRDVGTGLVYSAPLPTRPKWGETITKAATTLVRPRLYSAPDRRGVSALFEESNKALPKRFMGSTVYRSDFIDLRADLVKLQDACRSPAAFQKAFFHYSRGGELDTMLLPKVLDMALGERASEGIKSKFAAAFSKSRAGFVSWDDFRQKLGQILEAAVKEGSSGGVSVPEWLVLSSKPIPKVIVGPALKSCYQCDMGLRNENPQTKPYTYKAGMYSTSYDLLRGTTKDTYHLPGYDGFIPESRRNSFAITQVNAKRTRASRERIAENVKPAVSGYTGHIPSNLINDRGPPLCGLNPLTTTGAGARHWML